MASVASEQAAETIQPSLLDVGEIAQGVRVQVCDAALEQNGRLGTVDEWQKTTVRVRMDGQGPDEAPVVFATTAVGVVTAGGEREDAAITPEEEEAALQATLDAADDAAADAAAGSGDGADEPGGGGGGAGMLSSTASRLSSVPAHRDTRQGVPLRFDGETGAAQSRPVRSAEIPAQTLARLVEVPAHRDTRKGALPNQRQAVPDRGSGAAPPSARHKQGKKLRPETESRLTAVPAHRDARLPTRSDSPPADSDRPRSTKRRSAPKCAEVTQKGTRRAEVAAQRAKKAHDSAAAAFGGGAPRHEQVS